MSNQKLPLPCNAVDEILKDTVPRITVAIPWGSDFLEPKRSLLTLVRVLFLGWRGCHVPTPVAVRVDVDEIEIEFEGRTFLSIWRSRARPSRALLSGCRECGGFINGQRVRQGTPKPGVVHHVAPPEENAAPQ